MMSVLILILLFRSAFYELGPAILLAQEEEEKQ
jgi:hypothetical protein